ncbi:hypothetical protein X975_04899, partial [Stegodyphus mimosarum]
MLDPHPLPLPSHACAMDGEGTRKDQAVLIWSGSELEECPDILFFWWKEEGRRRLFSPFYHPLPVSSHATYQDHCKRPCLAFGLCQVSTAMNILNVTFYEAYQTNKFRDACVGN